MVRSPILVLVPQFPIHNHVFLPSVKNVRVVIANSNVTNSTVLACLVKQNDEVKMVDVSTIGGGILDSSQLTKPDGVILVDID